MKSKCLSERLKVVPKRWNPRESSLVAIKHLCNHAWRPREASFRSAQACFCAETQEPGPVQCRRPAGCGGEEPSAPEGRTGLLPEEAGREPALGQGVAAMLRSLPGGLSPAQHPCLPP